jgi:hypothetical protein
MVDIIMDEDSREDIIMFEYERVERLYTVVIVLSFIVTFVSVVMLQ